MKALLLTIPLVFCGQAGSQTHVKDYLIPEGKNKSVFFMPDASGRNSGLEKTIWFIQRGNSFELLESNTMNGTTGSIVSSFIEVSDDKVMLTKTIFTSVLAAKRVKVYRPPQVYLKLPLGGKKVTWHYTEAGGDSYNCSAELSTVEIDSQERSSIKVTKQLVSKDPETASEGSKVEQYVLGIGLWHVMSRSGIVIDTLEGQFLDPDVDQFK